MPALAVDRDMQRSRRRSNSIRQLHNSSVEPSSNAIASRDGDSGIDDAENDVLLGRYVPAKQRKNKHIRAEIYGEADQHIDNCFNE